MTLGSLAAGVVGGLQTSFLNGMVLSLQEHGMTSYIQTCVFLLIAGILASF